MAYKIFADTNVFLDHLLQRTGDWQYAKDLFNLAEQKEITVFTSSSSLVNILYALKQQKIKQHDIILILKYLLSYISIAQTAEQAFIESLTSGFADLEDVVQYYTALKIKDVDYFITANIKDYKKAQPQLPVITAKQFLLLFRKPSK